MSILVKELSTLLELAATYTTQPINVEGYTSLSFSINSSETGYYTIEAEYSGEWLTIYKDNLLENSTYNKVLPITAKIIRFNYALIDIATIYRNTFLIINAPPKDENALSSTLSKAFLKDAFGDLSFTEKNLGINVNFVYKIHPDIATTSLSGSATATTANSLMVLQTGTTAASSAILNSVDYIRYSPGTGLRCFATPFFGIPHVDTHQFVGFGNDDNGYFIGFNGLEFGILYKNAGVETWIPQHTFNRNTLPFLDHYKGNLFITQLTWLGVGCLQFSIQEPHGSITLFHVIEYPNKYLVPSSSNPSYRSIAFCDNGATTTNIILKACCLNIYIEGSLNYSSGIFNSAFNSATIAASTLTTILSIRVVTSFGGVDNFTPVLLQLISLASDGNKSVRFEIIKNAPLVGAIWNYIDVNKSLVEYSTSPITAISGRVLLSSVLGKTGNTNINLEPYRLQINPGENISIVAYTTNATNENSVSLSFKELF